MIGRLVGGAVNLARPIEYFVQARWTIFVSFEQLLPLTDLDPLNPALIVVSSVFSLLLRRLCLLHRGLPLPSLASEVPGSLVLLLLRANQLSSLAQKRVMCAIRAAMDFGFSWPRCRASHSSRTLCLKAARASAFGQSTIWFFFKNLVQSLR